MSNFSISAPGGTIAASMVSANPPVDMIFASAYPPSGIPAVSGTRMVVMGDSRMDNGTIAQSTVSPAGFQTGVPEGLRLQGIHTWMLHQLDWPLDVIGQWTQGGGKSSQFCHDHALSVMAARNPDVVIMIGPTNDPIDYTGGGGLGPVPLGDAAADPATLPRVADREPTSPGVTGTQGTTFGNLDKLLRFWGDGSANGLGRSVPVILFEIPSESPSRGPQNIAVHNWLMAQKAAETYPNLIAPNIFTAFLTDPGNLSSPVRRDLKPDGTAGADGDGNVFIHPTPDEARFLGETMAADSDIVAALAGLSSLQVLPDGTNDASFINPNPTVSVGDGSGTLGYAGSSSPAPTGTVAEDWSLGHSVTTGSIGVVGSFDAGDQLVTITRTGGASAGTGRTVDFRSDVSIPITPVAGDIYVLEAEVVAPARNPADLFAVFPHIFFNEPGLQNDYAQDISAGTYGSFASNSPNTFPNEGATLTVRSVPLRITPQMVSTTTGTIDLQARCSILFNDTMDTATNGALVVRIKSLGIRKLTAAAAHVLAPGKPVAGPSVTTAPSISGNMFVGSTITINDGAAASGSVTSRRLLKNGSPVTLSGSSYTLVSGDLGADFVAEVTWTSGGGASVAVSPERGPVTEVPATLAAAIAAMENDQNNALFDFRNQSVSGANWSSPDLTANGNTAVQPNLVRHPGLSSTLGATLDGVNDCMGYTWQTAAPSTVTVVMRLIKDASDISGFLLSDHTTTNFAGQFNDGASTPLPNTWTVDGSPVATLNDLHDALDDGLAHTVMVTGLNVSGWPALFFSRLSGSLLGSIFKGGVIDEVTADLANTRTKLVAWVEDSA